ncbi:hypothetical protein Pmani_002397 [Petrolisthes manimaculis]|uniref:Uncharacterized protein n=1 Tax=Petrolisthes manimaculis TaxID=1843537 RepID=A0AAE1QKJ7_9EUCA|nr:hypothetical protein Pmani_002397 [Petrolisthes manimaculis]
MASNQVNLVEGEQAVALSDALLDRAAEEASQATENNKEDTQPVDKTKVTGERKRLYFYNSCVLTLSQKRLWSAKLAQQYRSFKPTLKEGLNRPFITVEDTEAVVKLTTEGYDGVVMEQPKDTGNLTKVFIAPYDRLLDPELLLDDDRVVWAKRHVVRGEKKKSVVALVRGEVPEKLHVLGNGYRRVHKYIEQPITVVGGTTRPGAAGTRFAVGFVGKSIILLSADIMREMRENFAKLYEKVDTLEKKYEAKMDTLEKKCEEKINAMEKKYEALKKEMSAAKGNNNKKDDEEEITPLELKQKKITQSSLWEAVVIAVSNSNSSKVMV